MTQNHHISDELLMSYEAGSLAEGWSLAVATHLAYCAPCRARAREAAHVGGALLDAIEVAPLRSGALEAVLARIAATQVEPAAARRAPERTSVPSPLRSYIGTDLDTVAWRKLGTRARQFVVKTGDGETSVRLLRISAGAPVPEHGHRGLELTVVLRGTLVDDDERFGVGDVEEADSSVEHQPRAGEDEDCICLAVTDAPLRFKSLLVRLAQPFLKI
jgi:putative transcriptional regulator